MQPPPACVPPSHCIYNAPNCPQLQVAYGVAGVLTPGDTFGVFFTPGALVLTNRPPLTLTRDPKLPAGCSYYTVMRRSHH